MAPIMTALLPATSCEGILTFLFALLQRDMDLQGVGLRACIVAGPTAGTTLAFINNGAVTPLVVVITYLQNVF
jgi:hypothetical protein